MIIVLAGLASPVAAVDTIQIAMGEWAPYLSNDLKHHGVVAHLIQDVLEEEGYQVKMTFLPWGRAYEITARGKQDLMGVWMHKAEREVDFLYSEPVLEEQFVFFHLKKYSFDWRTLDDLQGLIIGGGNKFSYGHEFDAALESGKLTIQRVSNAESNFRKLLAGRIQIYPNEINVGTTVMKSEFSKKDVARITTHPKVLLNNVSYVLFPKRLPTSQVLMERFNARLAVFRATGRYKKYFKAFQQGEYDN